MSQRRNRAKRQFLEVPLSRPQTWRQSALGLIYRAGGRAGVTEIDAEQGPKFLDYLLALEAAVASLGVAILDKHVVACDLERGRLLIPFDVDMEAESTYYLVYPQARANNAKIAAFRDWLLAQVPSENHEKLSMPDNWPLCLFSMADNGDRLRVGAFTGHKRQSDYECANQPPVEEYLNDPKSLPPSEWQTAICMPIKKGD